MVSRGPGKCSLVKLLVGIHCPTKDRILYNDKKSAIEICLGLVQICFVTQNQLFAGTIRKDLLFVKPDANNKELLKVLRQTDCDPTLERASRGLILLSEKGKCKFLIVKNSVCLSLPHYLVCHQC